MFIRKAAFEFLELWSETEDLLLVMEGCIIDWRWFATRTDGRDEEEPSFANECALIH